MKIKVNPDIKERSKISKAILDNNGYCPCKIQKIDQNKCMCEQFRQFIKNGNTGYCECGLYYAEEEE